MSTFSTHQTWFCLEIMHELFISMLGNGRWPSKWFDNCLVTHCERILFISNWLFIHIHEGCELWPVWKHISQRGTWFWEILKVITAACDYLSPPRSSRIDHSSNKCTPLCVSAPLIWRNNGFNRFRVSGFYFAFFYLFDFNNIFWTGH